MNTLPRRIAILGTGPMGRAVGAAASRAGQEVVFGSGREGTREQALASSDFVVLALRWQGVPAALESSADLFSGKTVVDLSNPATPDGLSLLVGHSTSGAEEIARLLPRARVVKALNHVYAEVLEAGTAFRSGPPAAFYCGDDPDAKLRVAAWLGSLGFDAVDAGPLRSARWLEPLAQLAVELVENQGRPAADTAFALAGR